MKDQMARLALAIASLGLTDSELHDLLRRLRRIPIEDMTERIASIQHSSLAWSFESKTADTRFEVLNRPNRDATVGERVERLLKIEAKLPSAIASTKLAEMMVQSGLIARGDIPPLSKKALRLWIDRVVHKVPAKEVLRCATVLRNEYVHNPGPDWTIGPRSE